MRLGVLDVGSNTVHLLVMDAHPGARPLPAYSHKADLRLAELLDERGAIAPAGVDALIGHVADAVAVAEDKGVEEVLPFATSAIREAVNGDEVLTRVAEATGITLTVLSGQEEARLTFLAARRWFGWSAGRLLVLDIGGGSLEAAFGMDEDPAAAVSLPLGAGRLTAAALPGDPPSAQDIRALRRRVRTEIARTVADFARLGTPDHVVGTSKTFRQLARIAGATPFRGGALRPAHPQPRRPGGLGAAPHRHARRRPGGPPRRVRRTRPAAPRRGPRGGGRDGPVRRRGTGDLPVGAPRGRDPPEARPHALTCGVARKSRAGAR